MKFISKVYSKFLDRGYGYQKISYSQCGEDLIVDFLLTWILKIKKPTYIDIGAHHPYYLNNTYLFYKRGLTGINIEPDPFLFESFKKARARDVNINKGIGFKNENEIANFYVMSARTLNTFSKEEAQRISEIGDIKIERIQQVELVNINSILLQYFRDKEIDFLSIDVEGLDLEIIKSIDYTKFKPNIICIETIIYNEGKLIKKLETTIEFLLSMGYLNYADTSINTIFVRKDLFKEQGKGNQIV